MDRAHLPWAHWKGKAVSDNLDTTVLHCSSVRVSLNMIAPNKPWNETIGTKEEAQRQTSACLRVDEINELLGTPSQRLLPSRSSVILAPARARLKHALGSLRVKLREKALDKISEFLSRQELQNAKVRQNLY